MTTPLGPGHLIYAHRGDRSRARDNTIEAYSLAVEAGTDGIELDVRRSSDGELIVTHDDRDATVGIFSEMTFAVVREMAPHIPTLEEAMGSIPLNVFVNVEIKNSPTDAGFDEDRTIVNQTVEALRTFDDPGRILLSSFDPATMTRACHIASDFRRGQLLAEPTALDVGVAFAADSGMQALHPRFGQLRDDPERSVASVKAAGLAVVVWAVDTADDIRVMARAGADVIITDNPAMAREAIA